MSVFNVIRKSDGATVYEYQSDAPVEWVDYPFAEFDHVVQPEGDVVVEPVDPARWRIWVGAFFDRFGAYKIPILASEDVVVQACIKDASVRKYIDLLARRDELTQMLGLLQVKGFAVDVAAILDTEPADDEVWHD